MSDPSPRTLLCTLAELAELSDALLRQRGAPLRFTARGGSMRPCIQDGDVVVVEPCSHPRLGDVALVAENGRVVLHRVVGRASVNGEAYVVTQGDAAPHPDPPAPLARVLGRVAQVERGGRVRRMPTGIARALAHLLARARWALRRARWRVRTAFGVREPRSNQSEDSAPQ
jgi:signal peptidase I